MDTSKLTRGERREYEQLTAKKRTAHLTTTEAGRLAELNAKLAGGRRLEVAPRSTTPNRTAPK